MRRVLRVTGIGLAILLPVATIAGWLIGGTGIGWGILLGLAIPAAFFGITVITGVLAAKLDNGPFVAVVMALWLVKIIALLVVMALIKDAEFYSKPAFVAAFIVGIAGWLTAEVVVVLRTKVPYVEVPRGA
jgi:hypothetical protein